MWNATTALDIIVTMSDCILNIPVASLRTLGWVGFPRPELVTVTTTIFRYNFSRSSLVLAYVSIISLIRFDVWSWMLVRFSLMMSCREPKLVSKYTCICIVASEGECTCDSFLTHTSTKSWTSSSVSGRSEMKPCSGFRTINLIWSDTLWKYILPTEVKTFPIMGMHVPRDAGSKVPGAALATLWDFDI